MLTKKPDSQRYPKKLKVIFFIIIWYEYTVMLSVTASDSIFLWPLYSIRLSSVLQIRNKDLSFNIDLALLHTKSMFLVICKYPMINAFLTSCWHLFNLKKSIYPKNDKILHRSLEELSKRMQIYIRGICCVKPFIWSNACTYGPWVYYIAIVRSMSYASFYSIKFYHKFEINKWNVYTNIHLYNM